MKIDKKSIDILACMFFKWYTTTEDRLVAMKILKLLDFEYNIHTGDLTYEGSPFVVYNEDTIIDGIDLKIAPIKLSMLDIECLETVVNSLDRKDVQKIAPIVETMGWMLRYELDSYKIHFVGGPLYDAYDMWLPENEEVPSWDCDILKNAIDWWSGDDWEDGVDLDGELPNLTW